MGKLKLDLESVQVESFEVSPDLNGGSTIHGYEYGEEQAVAGIGGEVTNSPSCPTNGCGTCYETCWNSCAASCPGTSGATTAAADFAGF